MAADVCKVLGITNVGDALTRLNRADIGSTDVWSTRNNRSYATKIVNEPGLYSLILRAVRTPGATAVPRVPGGTLRGAGSPKRFKRRVTPRIINPLSRD
ncbi:BRO family protein [Pseudonocardia sp. NPDC046786]|uniref:BRO-N domain-containing protein n=1 Tax=Pseudonocardia sp. NPDC046786 TaxID=3155471 RepID=UPI0034105151